MSMSRNQGLYRAKSIVMEKLLVDVQECIRLELHLPKTMMFMRNGPVSSAHVQWNEHYTFAYTTKSGAVSGQELTKLKKRSRKLLEASNK